MSRFRDLLWHDWLFRTPGPPFLHFATCLNRLLGSPPPPRQAPEADEKARRLEALTYARDPALVKATLAYALSPEVRAQDTPSVILGVAQRGGASLQAAWAFLRTCVDLSLTSESCYCALQSPRSHEDLIVSCKCRGLTSQLGANKVPCIM